jgi:hypothetical protein
MNFWARMYGFGMCVNLTKHKELSKPKKSHGGPSLLTCVHLDRDVQILQHPETAQKNRAHKAYVKARPYRY